MRDLLSGPSVTLEEMLALREERAALQGSLLSVAGCRALVCLTLNMAGPVKRCPLSDAFFQEGRRCVEALLPALGPCLETAVADRPGGQAVLFALDADPNTAKARMLTLEDRGGAARLWDIDVIRPGGTKVSRAELGLPPRRCFLCPSPAAVCARSRAHSASQLQAWAGEVLTAWYGSLVAGDIGGLAQRALLYEVSVTPKPGLVDRANSGAHRDMDFFTFIDSACALTPYFTACALLGFQRADCPPEELLFPLQSLGLEAEASMYRATGGVNTHKGAVFSMGLLCAAGGVLCRAGTNSRGADVAQLAGRIAAQATGGRFGLGGARGEASSGFPRVLTALDTVTRHLNQGLPPNDALAVGLLQLIALTEDTNIVKRLGPDALNRVRQEARDLLSCAPSMDALSGLDAAYIRRNVSPGGCADLLAAVCFLHFWESRRPGWSAPADNNWAAGPFAQLGGKDPQGLFRQAD